MVCNQTLLTDSGWTIQLVEVVGLVLFIFISVFSDYIRPFMVNAKDNFKDWLRGGYSVRTGQLNTRSPRYVPPGKTREPPRELE
jgi:hypothetical protein